MGVVQVLFNTMEHLKKIGTLFYVVNPYESMFKDVSDIPKTDVFAQAMPYFFGFVIIEHIILKLKGKRGVRLNDGIMSFANGIIMLMMQMFVKGFLMMAYFYIYNNWRIYELPWDSTITWIVAAILCDLGYYWVHRAAHELNILWAAHQVHHSSEDYNLTTALRQSMIMKFGNWPFYLPMAFFCSTNSMIVHVQFNLLYQFWIHTELVRDIGPLEHVLNTAKHHRVHHGSNRYCLDKNYAGVLIIWDRMFGTFEWERDDEKIVYGLVDQPQFFNPLKHQVFYYGKVLEKAQSMDNWTDKIWAVLKGPGWFPGTDRLGDPLGVPEIQHREKYDPKVADWVNVYTVLHFVLVFLTFDDLGHYNLQMSQTSVLGICLFLFWTLTNIGMIFDKNQWAWLSEGIRAMTFLMLYVKFSVWNEFRIPYQILVASFSVSSIIAMISVTQSALKSLKGIKSIKKE